MHPVRCLVYGGSSSIVASLIRRAPQNIVFALLTRVTDSAKDAAKEEYLRACQKNRSTTQVLFYKPGNAYAEIRGCAFDVVLTLTTHPDPVVLSYIRAMELPHLYISSGAVTDCHAARMQWNDYSLGKEWPEHFATLTLRCGFFIPDVEGELTPPAGIGMESARHIFGEKPLTDANWLAKKMYVTPVSSLIQAISIWINSSERLSGVFHFGTQCPLSRAYLRMRADLPIPDNFVHDALAPVYEKEWNKSKKEPTLASIPDTADVMFACQRAKAWISKM